MDEVIVESYQPILDVAIPVIDSLMESGRTRLIVPDIPEFWGLGLDVSNLIRSLYPDVELNLYREGKLTNRFANRRRDNISIRQLEIDIEGANFLPEIPKSAVFQIALLSSPDSTSKISVVAKKTRGDIPKNSVFSSIATKIPLPEQSRSMTLFLAYMGNTLVQTYFHTENAAIRYRDQKNQESTAYPVSLQPTYSLKRDTFEFIQEPLRWNGVIRYFMDAIDIITKKSSVDELMEQKYRRYQDAKSYIRDTIPLWFRLIECFAHGYSFDSVLDDIHCTPIYRGLFLSKTMAALMHFANKDTVNSPETRNIVDSYNREYAIPHGKPPLTVQQLCHSGDARLTSNY